VDDFDSQNKIQITESVLQKRLHDYQALILKKLGAIKCSTYFAPTDPKRNRELKHCLNSCQTHYIF
jgi:hypothetical protein